VRSKQFLAAIDEVYMDETLELIFCNYSGLKKVEDWSKMGQEQVV
jgi:hypothetical protein